MLPKENRLNKEQEIKAVLKKGKTFFLPEFIIKYDFNKEYTKVGFIISTKVDKRAVKRNLLKRRLRGVFNETLPNIKKGYYILVIAKKVASELTVAEIKEKITFALSRIKIYNE